MNISLRFIASVLSICILFLSAHHNAFAAVSTWQKSASFSPVSTTDFSSATFQQALSQFAHDGGNFATFIIPYYQSNLYSTDIHAGYNTPTDDSLVSAINYAHSLGLKVMLKPHLDSQTGEWRAQINPSDRNAWFSAYDSMINHYAAIASQTGAEEISVGAELSSMTTPSINSTNTTNWSTLIDQVRSKYTGKLTYSAQRDGYYGELSNIGFWNKLDYIGISAYYELATNTQTPSVTDLVNSWSNWNNTQIQPIAQQYQKPILFTEVGYRNVQGDNTQPWSFTLNGPSDQAAQDNLYQALFSFWNNQANMIGVHLWNWETNPNAGGANDTGYTPQNKQAEGTIKTWFTSQVTPTQTPTPTPVNNPSNYQISASITPSTPAINQSSQITTSVTPASAAGSVLVDIEIYNSSQQKVFQQFFDNQSLSANTPANYPTTWTPSTPGTYTVQAGIFNSNWNGLLFWQNNALSFTVGNTPTTTPAPTPTITGTPTLTPTPSIQPTSGQLDIWWPTNGSSISGVQPFKAIVENLSLSQYTMYWQVDGGAMNQMSDSQQNSPHKEALVDVSGWNWRGNGPYNVTFSAKNTSGSVIAQKSVSISVQH